jgi:hypothetical protein
VHQFGIIIKKCLDIKELVVQKTLMYGPTYSALLLWMEKNIKHHALATVAKEKQEIIPSAYEVGWVQRPPWLRRGRKINFVSGNQSSVRHLAGGTDRAAAAVISILLGHLRDQ